MATSTGTGSISGLGSGYDWASMIKDLRKVEENRLVPYKSELSKSEDRLGAWRKTSTLLSRFQTAVSNLKNLDANETLKVGLTSSKASVAASSLVSVTTGSGAVPGQYNLVVNQLARAEKLQTGDGVNATDLNDALGRTGVLTINGKDLALDGTEGLGALKTKINGLDAGVVANILQDKDGVFHLTMTSTTTGAAGISLADLAGDDALFSTTPLQEGRDAAFTVDGFSMTSANNTTDTAIPGLTLNLVAADPEVTVEVSVGWDSEDTKKKVQDFVQAYNDLSAFYDEQMSYTPGEESSSGALFGDTTLKSIKRSLQTILLDSNPSRLGISLGSDNRLTLDSDRLDAAVKRDSNGTLDAFASMAEKLDRKLTTYNDDIDGTVTLKGKSIQNNIDRLNDRIESMATMMDRRMTLLKTKYMRMDSALYQFTSMSDYLTSQISSLSKSKE